MADQQLVFLGWVRERVAGLVGAVEHGRARAEMAVTLTGTDAAGAVTSAATRPVRFLLAGPADVVGLAPHSIVKRYPTPGAIDHESDRCPHVEFTDPSLPWRYTPAPKPPAAAGALHSWLVLVVGVEGEDLTLAGGQVSLSPAVQQLHPLGAPTAAHPWAHVQVDAEGRRVARLLSGRLLEPGTDYVAALVPAFDAAGQRRWTGTGGATVTAPLYDHWRFRTAVPAGSFEDLAARLRPGAAAENTGRAPLDYPRVPTAGDLEVRGALAPVGVPDAPLPSSVRTDLDGLRTARIDEVGRPVVGLPRYGEAWHLGAPETTTWGSTLNTDPRDRGVAGLGLEIGIRRQEDLAAEAVANAGALAEARQRVSQLVLGLSASAALWRRRVPSDPVERLWVFGPALRRVVTDSGTVADLTTADERALPRGLFSSAARRALRAGPARTAVLRDRRAGAGEVLESANRCPPPPEPSRDGIPVDDPPIEAFEERRREAIETGALDIRSLLEQAEKLADVPNADLGEMARALVDRLREAAERGSPAPWARAISLLVAANAVAPDDKRAIARLANAMRQLLALFDEADDKDLLDLLDDLADPAPEEPPCRPVDLAGLADAVGSAFDPTREDSSSRVRVLANIVGLDPSQPLAPPEVCVGLDRPVWADVEDAFPEWLLPGVGALLEDSVIAVQTNPRFVDSLLVGLNTQLLSELRWRNIPIATGCTPLRKFWDRADTASGARVDDIVGIHGWSTTSDVGDAGHRPGGATGRDLAVVVRGHLFLRYPTTLVYLVTAEHGGVVDFNRDPPADAPRVYPTFQGRIGPDVTFFGFQGVSPEEIQRRWLVFEEPPSGYRFANDVSTAAAPTTWATQAFAAPVRVLIRGDELDPEGVA